LHTPAYCSFSYTLDTHPVGGVIDTSVFTKTSTEIQMQSIDLSKIGTYDMQVTGTLGNGLINEIFVLSVLIYDSCDDPYPGTSITPTTGSLGPFTCDV
jgi:hypothetical protein